MIARFRDFSHVLLTVLLLGVTSADAQTVQSGASQGASNLGAQAAAQSAGPAGPQINIAEIARRANQDVGVDIQTTITGWQHKLDQLESDLRAQRLRYSELNDLRDELQRIRSEIEDFSNHLQSPLTAKGPARSAGAGARRWPAA